MNTQTTIEELIPYGHDNRVGRRYLLSKCLDNGLIDKDKKDQDRMLRKLIEDAQIRVVICNAGDGFFRPTPDDISYLRHDILRRRMAISSMAAPLRTKEALLEDYETGRIK